MMNDELTGLTTHNNAGRRKGAITEINQVVESSLHGNEINSNQQASQ